jgi:hypothetical protein
MDTTHIYDLSVSWLCTGSWIKMAGLSCFYGPNISS